MIFGLKGEIKYSRAPLEEALERVGRRENGFLGRLFTGAAREIAASREETFSKIWEKQVELIKKGPQGEILDEKDIKQLAGLGGRLGYLDVDMQERTLLLYLEQLELSISRLRGKIRFTSIVSPLSSVAANTSESLKSGFPSFPELCSDGIFPSFPPADGCGNPGVCNLPGTKAQRPG